MAKKTVLGNFHRRLNALEHTRARMDSLYTNGTIKLRDIASIYEAIFVRAVVGFERFCEDLFVGIVNHSILYSPRRVLPKVSVYSDSTLIELIKLGRSYAEWLPYHHTKT